MPWPSRWEAVRPGSVEIGSGRSAVMSVGAALTAAGSIGNRSKTDPYAGGLAFGTGVEARCSFVLSPASFGMFPLS